jgi:hypothetical protein
MSMFYANAMRGYGLGAKYGIMEGLHRYQHTTETPKMDDSAMQGAIGIIIAVGGVLIALYIIAVVVGSISYAVTSGNIKLSPTWNTTISNLILVEKILANRLAERTNIIASFVKRTANKRAYRFASTSHIQLGKCSANRHNWGGYPHDRDWGLQRTWYLSTIPNINLCRPSNKAYA